MAYEPKQLTNEQHAVFGAIALNALSDVHSDERIFQAARVFTSKANIEFDRNKFDQIVNLMLMSKVIVREEGRLVLSLVLAKPKVTFRGKDADRQRGAVIGHDVFIRLIRAKSSGHDFVVLFKQDGTKVLPDGTTETMSLDGIAKQFFLDKNIKSGDISSTGGWEVVVEKHPNTPKSVVNFRKYIEHCAR